MENSQEESSKKVEIQTTSTSTTTIKEGSADTNPEVMSLDDLHKEIERIAAGKSCFWSDQGKEAWLKRLETRAIALSTVEILRRIQALMAPKA